MLHNDIAIIIRIMLLFNFNFTYESTKVIRNENQKYNFDSNKHLIALGHHSLVICHCFSINLKNLFLKDKF